MRFFRHKRPILHAESAATIPSKAGFVDKFYHKKDLEHPGKNRVYKGGYERKEAAALTDPGDGMRRLSDISSVEVGGGG